MFRFIVAVALAGMLLVGCGQGAAPAHHHRPVTRLHVRQPEAQVMQAWERMHLRHRSLAYWLNWPTSTRAGIAEIVLLRYARGLGHEQ